MFSYSLLFSSLLFSSFLFSSRVAGNKVDGDLFDWWFRQCDDSEKYRWAHPESNISCTWDPTFYRSMPHERQRCYYIDHVQYVEKAFAGMFMSLQIEYLRPSKYFDITLFKQNKVSSIHNIRFYLFALAISYDTCGVRQRSLGS